MDASTFARARIGFDEEVGCSLIFGLLLQAMKDLLAMMESAGGDLFFATSLMLLSKSRLTSPRSDLSHHHISATHANSDCQLVPIFIFPRNRPDTGARELIAPR